MAITERQADALTILKDTSALNGISSRNFAEQMWPNSSMHTRSKNTGNGACTGKGAWLCAGSYLAKLQKLGLVYVNHRPHTEYWITQKGREALNEHSLKAK